MDHRQLITHRLYRQHTHRQKDIPYAIKDLNKLGRPLEKTIIIDNIKENFEYTSPDNGI